VYLNRLKEELWAKRGFLRILMDLAGTAKVAIGALSRRGWIFSKLHSRIIMKIFKAIIQGGGGWKRKYNYWRYDV